jgi:hypothetical protein
MIGLAEGHLKLWGVCMFAYISRTDKPIHAKVVMLIFGVQEESLERSELRKIFLSSSPVEGSSSSSETKHDRRPA